MVNPNHRGSFLIRDGERVAIADGYLQVNMKGNGERGISLPGHGKFTSFGVYPDAMLRPAPQNLPMAPAEDGKAD